MKNGSNALIALRIFRLKTHTSDSRFSAARSLGIDGQSGTGQAGCELQGRERLMSQMHTTRTRRMARVAGQLARLLMVLVLFCRTSLRLP